MVKPSDIVAHGCTTGCPFCNALAWTNPSLGMRLTQISGFHCGARGELIELETDPDVLICRMDGDPESYSYRLNRRLELIIPEEDFATPTWAPPLSLEDASYIHQAMATGFASSASESPSQNVTEQAFKELVCAIWGRRLPLVFDDIWPMLIAHGWNSDFSGFWMDRYSFGTQLLYDATGKKPIKRKRMKPFDADRYVAGSR